ncbi:beta-N-acetylhexosaminidase [Wenzhouxiangella sp. AB-CW3]|uniref:beta-N-acetylhexosaminidase n=1 Tax=Wenzhouxiangella sp. AB-CW3 TaxID=2771012 RepID=UPI00168ADAEA|nr:beta-N-acetylhexosaminidase [Wenzhouxiangella sp. AB-CW3]QOC21267.1 beta-N-acetylhexosaminidase [Wenzhouxiangella sp. AB-CW3]
MSVASLPLGPLIVGFDGLRLDDETRDMLRHPSVGGVILFARNFQSPRQLTELTGEIAALRQPRLLITVDQEGGRVQRFRDGFTLLPPLAVLGQWYSSHRQRACDLAYRHGRVMAAELLAHGVDLSWAPVLDLDRGSCVIGDRAMASTPAAVIEIGGWYLAGMRDAGMRTCGKHFPGHGSVEADSHHEVVVDRRSDTALEEDLSTFAGLSDRLDGVMMAHVIYPAVDERPAGFSPAWVRECLRGRLGFDGVVVSDDLDMLGAAPAGTLPGRLQQALAAGCDAVLACRAESARSLLEDAPPLPAPAAGRLESLYGKAALTLDEQLQVPEFRAWRDSLKLLAQQWKK